MKHVATAMLMGTLSGLTGTFAFAAAIEGAPVAYPLVFGAITGLFIVMTIYDLMCVWRQIK